MGSGGPPGRATQGTVDGPARLDPPVGDWLVVPGPATDRMWRWGRIVEVIRGEGPLHYRVRWYGDTHDTVVLPPPDARIESADAWPHPGSGAFGLWPAV
jgi:Domain of unknown function (DUF1918)